jgi:hypothetical protein
MLVYTVNGCARLLNKRLRKYYFQRLAAWNPLRWIGVTNAYLFTVVGRSIFIRDRYPPIRERDLEMNVVDLGA